MRLIQLLSQSGCCSLNMSHKCLGFRLLEEDNAFSFKILFIKNNSRNNKHQLVIFKVPKNQLCIMVRGD